ncbi:multicopper oxidase family protein [Neptunicoccus sediminis]|uniref:multicopper oxidase family protein n=1 Tax=Neptunicoccus sediminis TaxID=1892596 RepID=UPI000AEB0679|nr:multicopper oxidase family protein [Neptunicoccus sediminis]
MFKTQFLNRRQFLVSGAAFAASMQTGAAGTAAPAAPPITLRAAAGQAALRPAPFGMTPVWQYNGSVPGAEIRVRQGERLRIEAQNQLPADTTIHWHGIRTPNAMDGVAGLTQAPIKSEDKFLYEFDALDAGTFWYHPHHNSAEQVARGLYGPLIVEEHDPIRVDREVTWMLDDWRLTEDGAIAGGFGAMHDAAHGGRMGNTVTINGRMAQQFAVKPAERIRLRLINAANARIFGLDFGALSPVVIALDGQPVTPHTPDSGVVVIGPAMRVDLVLDMTGPAGAVMPVTDVFYNRMEYKLVDLVHDATPLRNTVPDWSMELAPNPLSEPDLAKATRHEVIFNGGMMGQGMMGGGMMSMMNQMRQGNMWFINGVAAKGPVKEPFLTLAQGTSHILSMENRTDWPHPIHFHGHSFRVIARNGQATRYQEWQDTVMMAPDEKVDIAFVADNPGDWMFHCHILEHQAAGMMGVIRVAPQA